MVGSWRGVILGSACWLAFAGAASFAIAQVGGSSTRNAPGSFPSGSSTRNAPGSFGATNNAATANNTTNQNAATATGVSAEEFAYGGYCGVTLRDQKKWVPGSPAFSAPFDGRIYRFAGAQERNTFLADAGAYAPALGGDCMVTYMEQGQRVPGDLNFGVYYQNRYYFFATQALQQKFNENPNGYINADVANNGNCPVTLQETSRTVAGRPEFAVLYRDLRYYCADQNTQTAFLQNPAKYSASALAEEPRIALEGYCAVCIKALRQWVEGNKQFAVIFDGQKYVFGSQKQVDMFRADPFGYAPVMGGDCVVTYAANGQRTAGSVYHAAFYRDRLYLFPSDAEKRMFKTNPAGYSEVDIANNGNCVVTRVDLRREQPGNPQVWDVYDGLRYYFATQTQRDVFLANPDKYAVAATPAN